MAEPLGGGGPAHLYESLVAIIFRCQDRDRRLAPVYPSESDDAVGYLYHPVSDTINGDSCEIKHLKKRLYCMKSQMRLEMSGLRSERASLRMNV